MLQWALRSEEDFGPSIDSVVETRSLETRPMSLCNEQLQVEIHGPKGLLRDSL